ncbi:hypothetical protein BDZ89DRAFT_133225 [Hymenopellis radicata]|nr:hypothetical protein BDZ89DRAFT_133225 [Hymenopellis radicata]
MWEVLKAPELNCSSRRRSALGHGRDGICTALRELRAMLFIRCRGRNQWRFPSACSRMKIMLIVATVLLSHRPPYPSSCWSGILENNRTRETMRIWLE